MKQEIISFGGVTIRVSYPHHLSENMSPLLSGFQHESVADVLLEINLSREPDQEHILVHSISREFSARLAVDEIAEGFLTFLTDELSTAVNERMVFHSAAVKHAGHSIIIAGPAAVGKSILAAWFASRDYQYLTDEMICIDEDEDLLECMHRPLNIRIADYPKVAELLRDKIVRTQPGKATSLTYIKSPSEKNNENSHQLPSLIIFPRFSLGHTLTIEPLTPAKTGLKLMSCLVNARNLGGHGMRQVSTLARKIPALMLTYGSTEQLDSVSDELLPFIAGRDFSPPEIMKFFSPFKALRQELHQSEVMSAPVPTEDRKAVPEPTPVGPKKRLTIGMATYDDFDGVYFTVQAIRMYHPEITELSEILVVDNNPEGPCANDLKKLEDSVQGYRYLPYRGQSGTAVRDYIFRQANADYVLSVDCHVLIVPGALKKLIDFLDQRGECRDLLQGPMLNDNNSGLSTHFNPEWNEGMYGTWASDPRGEDSDASPFEIPMHGLGLFACRKDAWVGFNSRFRGFGGEEGYIHEKFRQFGGKTYCLPFLRWMHRFQRPLGVPYPLNWKDRIHNYMVGFKEIGIETSQVEKHFRDHLGCGAAAAIFQEIDAEIKSPFFHFDAIYCITMDEGGERFRKMQQRLTSLGIGQRLRTFRAVATPDNHHIGCALSHRAIIAEAKQQGLGNVLVFEDDALFLDDTVGLLDPTIKELKQQDWQIFYLGGHRWGKSYPLADHCHHLRRPQGLTCTHAIAYNRIVFEKILEEIPDTIDTVTDWAKKHLAIDQFLRHFDGLYLAEPVVASQKQLLPQENEEYRSRFTLGET